MKTPIKELKDWIETYNKVNGELPATFEVLAQLDMLKDGEYERLRDLLIDFQLYLNEKGLINNYDFNYRGQAKKYLKQCTKN